METSSKLSLKDLGNDDQMLSEGVSAPDLDSKGKPRRKAFRDESQVFSVFTQLESDNRHRTTINAEIVSRELGKPPNDPKDLQAHGQDWRSNFPTRSLAGIVNRIVGRLVNTIDNLRVLTNSRLPEDVPDHDEKSKKFQERLTAYIRRWTGWRPFISSLCKEVVLIGYAATACLDDYNWRIRLFRSDEAFLPQGCGQHPDQLQVLGIKQSFMVHEAVEWIADGEEIADVAGYQFDNVIKSVNKATSKNPLLDQQGAGNVSRAYQDLIREGNIGMSFSTGAKGINVAHVLGIEPKKDEDGNQVTHYILDRDNEHNALLIKENRFKSMKDVVALFTLEPGNSTYHGSLGIGRMCVNCTAAMDATANNAVDAYRLSACGTLVTDSKSGMVNQFEIKNPFVIVKTDGELQQRPTFNFNPEGFKALYAQLAMILEQMAGEYLPNIPADPEDSKKDKETATASRINFQREQEQSIAFIARFLGQFFDMVQPIQTRLCDPETTDEDAKQFQKELQEIDGLQPDEIAALAKSCTAEVVQDLAQQRNQQISAVAQLYTGNPNVDQVKLLKYNVISLSSPQVADELVLKDAVDPTVQAEQVRQQILENAAIQIGDSVPISPRDDDKEHLNVVIGEFGKGLQGVQKKQPTDSDLPGILDNLNALSVHGEAHISSWQRKGGKQPSPEIEKYAQKLKSLDADLTKIADVVKKSLEQKQVAAQKQLQDSQTPLVLQPGEQPPSQNGQAQPQGEPQEQTYGGMSEKVTTAWIGQYPNLPDAEKRKLESKAGLGALEPQESQPQPTASQPPPSNGNAVPTSPLG